MLSFVSFTCVQGCIHVPLTQQGYAGDTVDARNPLFPFQRYLLSCTLPTYDGSLKLPPASPKPATGRLYDQP